MPNPPLPRTCCAKCFKTQVDTKQQKCVHCGHVLNRLVVQAMAQQVNPPKASARL